MPKVTRMKEANRLRFFSLAFVVVSGLSSATFAQEEDIDGFRRILSRGQIASIDEPEFVKAQEAEIDGDAWVLGVVLGGEARAYSLNLLNGVEVVNDEISDQQIAAVW